MSDPFIGEIRLFGCNFAPRGWEFCDGQLLPISSNSALFSLLGTIYGGDGRTTFALPDLRGRAAIGFGTGPGLTPRAQGQKLGAEGVALNVGQIPSHNHTLAGVTGNATLNAVSDGGDDSDPAGNYLAALDDGYASAGTEVAMNENSVSVNLTGGSVGDTGSGQAHDNMQPFLVGNYCIALVGIFPPRS